MTLLTPEQLEEVRQFDTPSISNAIELFNMRPKTEGFMGSEIKCVLSYDKPMIGYVSTAKMAASKPATEEESRMMVEYYKKVKQTPSPTITVIQDIDPIPIGSFWGEVQASIHKTLGCVGTVTNGGVRDLDGVEGLGFGLFASRVLVSHCYCHIVDYDCPVEIGGLIVRPGDLLHADKHGVVLIPLEVAPYLADACRKMQYAEEAVIKECRARFDTGAEVEDVVRWKDEMSRRKDSK